ncbi:hypothetical protein ACQEU5_00560 [Marinactinospora thermotolerans]|uniref:hypothetical protein n=1 Tax=Marinactinospora thermotolerans TaxID=531310 RepID=UPI003D8F7D6A
MKRQRLVVGGAALGLLTVLGLLLGLLWWAIAPRPRVTVVEGGATAPFPLSETAFAAEGHYALMMMVAGLLCGYGGYLLQHHLSVRRRVDMRSAMLLGLAVGALTGSLAAWGVGTLLDAGAAQRAIEAARPGDVVSEGLHLRARSALLLWPFVTVLQYALFDAVSLWRGDVPRFDPPGEDGQDAAPDQDGRTAAVAGEGTRETGPA